jgi:DNA helicase-2/ATP-dependent DNA helicase PcrA
MSYSEFKEKYEINLNPQQEAAVQAVDGPVLLLAVPGSGKTTVLVTRLGYMVLEMGILPEKILTMTYTVSATIDMKKRFARLFGEELAERMQFRTINGLSARIIQYYERKMDRQAFKLITEESELNGIIGDIYRRKTGEFATESDIKTIRTWITYIKNMQLKQETIGDIRDSELDIGGIYREYCQVLRQRQKMDYDDQMVYALKILQQYPEILRDFQRKYNYLCVDEAQDTSKIQHSIIQLLANGNENLFMVGDEDQSIYGFRAAYPEALLEFEKVHLNSKVLFLEQNYRSTEEIVGAADKFIQRNKNRREKHMRAVNGSGAKLQVIDVNNRLNQYNYLVKVAKDSDRHTAILYRNNDSALPLIDRLNRENIPYTCRQFNGTFFSHRVVKDISNIIRFAYEPDNGELFLNIYYKLGAGISKGSTEWAIGEKGDNILETLTKSPQLPQWSKMKCRALLTHFANMRSDRGDKAVYRISHFMGYGDYLQERGGDMSKLDILEAIGVSEPSPMRLLERLDELSEIIKQDEDKRNKGIILSTIHSSKGLEYDKVYLMDVADSIFPACEPLKDGEGSEKERRAYEEERRLFYVGMTRAKKELAIFRFKKPELYSSFTSELFPPQRKKASHTTVPIRVTAPAQKSVDEAAMEPFKEHCYIEHLKFGKGEILRKEDNIITVEFENNSIKRFDLAIALGQGQIKIAALQEQ